MSNGRRMVLHGLLIPYPSSGISILPVELLTCNGSIQMDVRFQSFCTHTVVLIGLSLSAAPPIHVFIQNDIIYFGSDPDAFQSAFPCPITVIVSAHIPISRFIRQFSFFPQSFSFIPK